MQSGLTTDAGPEKAAAQALAQFQALVLQHNRTRRHFGKLANANHQAIGANPLCGDHLTVELHIEANTIIQCGFHGDMSAISIAAAEILCAQITRLSLPHAEIALRAAQAMLAGQIDLANTDEFHCFAVVRRYPSRLKTATLPVATLLAAVLGDASQVSTE